MATSEQWMEKTAAFYGITMEEARARHAAVVGQRGDPNDPICVGCAKRPHELAEYVEMAAVEIMTPVEYVIDEEGTYNRENGHFLCTACYIKNGQPSRPGGWVCP